MHPAEKTRDGAGSVTSKKLKLTQYPSVEILAEGTFALKGFKAEQVDVRGEEVFFYRLVSKEVGAQIFFVAVGEDGGDGGVGSQVILGLHSGEKIAARGDADSEAEARREFLRHKDGVAVGDGQDAVERAELHYRGNEFVRDALYAVLTDFMSGGEGGRFGGFDGMNFDRGMNAAEETADAHNRTAGADSGDEGIGFQSGGLQLSGDFRAGSGLVGLRIGFIGELARQEDARAAGGEFFGHANAAEEAALLFADGNDGGTVAANKIFAFVAHPVGHEDGDRMAKRGSDSGEGDARVAAGGFGDDVAGLNFFLLVGGAQNVQRHAVLDAARHVQLFGLGVEDALFAAIAKMNPEKRRVPGEAPQGMELLGQKIGRMSFEHGLGERRTR